MEETPIVVDQSSENQKLKRYKILGGGFVALFLVGLLLGVWWVKRNQFTLPTGPYHQPNIHEHLEVTNVYPQGKAVLPDSITFTFNQEVDEVELMKFFEILPNIEGNFVKTDDPNMLRFEPKTPFPRGAQVLTHIGVGLRSKNGKVLMQPHISTFETLVADNEVKFVSEELTGRVMSFQSGTPFKISTRVGNGLSNVNISVYRSTQANLLNYLIYTDVTHKPDPNYSYTNPEYKTNYIAHTKIQQVETYPLTEENKEKTFTLQPGIYYMEATGSDGIPVGSTFVLVNTYGLLARQDDQKVIFSTFDLATGQSSDITTYVGMYQLNAVPTQLKALSYSKFSEEVPLADKTIDAVIATINNETVFAPFALPQSFADMRVQGNLEKKFQTFLYTDRPIYQPGDTVFFRGVMRIDSDGLYKVPPVGTPVRVWTPSWSGSWLDTTVYTDKSGAFWGQATSPTSTGEQNRSQTLYASSDLRKTDATMVEGRASFDVIAYTKPTLQIQASVPKEEYLRGETVEFTLKARTLDEKPVADENISYTLYSKEFFEVQKAVYNKSFNVIAAGGMCGGGGFSDYFGDTVSASSVKTDSAGNVVVKYTLPSSTQRSQEITLISMTKDQAGNEITSAAKTIIHAADTAIFFPPGPSSFAPGENISIPVQVEKLNGELIANTSGAFVVKGTTYENANAKEQQIFSGTFQTDQAGNGTVQFVTPGDLKPQNLKLEVSLGSSNGIKEIWINEKPTGFLSRIPSYYRWSITNPYLKIRSSKNNYQVGEIAKLSVIAPKEMDVLLSLERGRIYKPRVLHLNAGENTVELEVTGDLSPSITPTFSFFADGLYRTEGLELNVPAMHKLLTVTISPDKETYAAAETAKLNVRISDAKGMPVSASFSLGVVDKAIYALNKNASPPIHSSLYFFRPRTTNASSSLTWIGSFGDGRGGGGGGGDNGNRPADTLFWKPNLVTDEQGLATVEVPLKGIAGAWRAQVIAATDQTDVGQSTVDFVSY